ncbi:hypothetical protein EGW08_010309 [Elysia chlorotica]|uniref:JmjC domain-containing protein n=1 Tax=Elysia chlorotica TaxID=188477 RepID=A0A433TK14_ELYCH|nr:hypothetical protein EGW08_010309 [Elysia chlorotica]
MGYRLTLEYLIWIHLLISVINLVYFVECTLPTFNSDAILNASGSSCHVLSFSDKNVADEITYVLQNLSDLSFRDEPTVIVGKISPQIDVHSFWPDSSPLTVHKGIKKETINQSIFIIGRLRKDRTCLLLPHKRLAVPSAVQIDIFPKAKQKHKFNLSAISLKIVNEINEKCNTFRNVDGSINIKGLHRNEILENLYHIPSKSNQNTENDDMFPSSFSFNHEQSQCVMADKTGDNVNCQVKYVEEQYDYCERISVPSQNHFFHEYLSLSKPVIVTGAITKWIALKKWTKSFLKEKYGKTRVHVKATPNGEYEGVQDKSLWERYKHPHIPKQVEDQLPYPDLVVERPASLDMLFSEFLDLIENISRGNTANMSAYLEYSSIADYFPELKSDIKELEFINMLELASLNIWLSDGNTLGKLHFDPFDNLLCQISGEKHVTLFEPHHNERLYEGHIQEAQFTFNESTGFFHRRHLLDSTSMVMSPVDLKKPDLERFPLFADTRPMKCSIKEGEVLFMPAFWWHEVQSTPNISQHRNLAVNFWYKPFLTKEFPCPECKLDVNPQYYNLL